MQMFGLVITTKKKADRRLAEADRRLAEAENDGFNAGVKKERIMTNVLVNKLFSENDRLRHGLR
jgi:hypothetical protein